MPTFEFFLDSRGLLTKDFEIDVTATLPKVTVQVFDGDTAVNLTGATVTFTLRDAAGAAVVLDAAATLLDATNGIVEYQLADADVDDVGFFFAQFKITISGESYLIPNDSTQRLRLRIGKEDVPAFSSVPASLPVHAGSHDLGGSDQIALEALIAVSPDAVWADSSRTDSYTEDGSFARPFKQIHEAIAFSYSARGAGATAPFKSTVFLMPSDVGYQIPLSELPIKLTDRIFIVGLSNLNQTIILPPVGAGTVDSDIFEIDHAGPGSSTYEFRSVRINVHTTGNAAIRIKTAINRFRLRDSWILSSQLQAGVFAVSVDHPSGTVRVDIDRLNLWSEFFVDLGVTPGIQFNFQDAGDCLVAFGSNFAEVKTNAAALAADVRLSNCRVGHEKITGGNAAQLINAAYCYTNGGVAGGLEPLDALDFQGEHTYRIVG